MVEKNILFKSILPLSKVKKLYYEHLASGCTLQIISFILFWLVIFGHGDPIWQHIMAIVLLSGFVITSIGVYLIIRKLKRLSTHPPIYEIVMDSDTLSLTKENIKRCWKLREIEFVYIDEDTHPLWGGKFVIKTQKTKQVNPTKNPRKFWSKIPQRDLLFNVVDTAFLEDIPTFVKALRGVGIKVYWRRKGSNIVEEVK